MSGYVSDYLTLPLRNLFVARMETHTNRAKLGGLTLHFGNVSVCSTLGHSRPQDSGKPPEARQTLKPSI